MINEAQTTIAKATVEVIYGTRIGRDDRVFTGHPEAVADAVARWQRDHPFNSVSPALQLADGRIQVECRDWGCE